MPKTLASVVLLFAVTVLAGCAGSREAAAPHPLTGAWDYSIDTPQGTFTGVIVFTEADDMLSGTIAGSQAPDQAIALEELMFDEATSAVSFSYDSGQYGVMDVNLTLADDALNGTMNVTQYNAEVPMQATRQTME